jgi:hypothetical protein
MSNSNNDEKKGKEIDHDLGASLAL